MLFKTTNPSQRTNLYGDTMYKYTQRITILGQEMYLWGYDDAQRESMFLRVMLMNPCKWRQDAYPENQSNDQS